MAASGLLWGIRNDAVFRNGRTMEGKKTSDSTIESRYLLMPNQANPSGTAFGGAIMSWIDMIACMAAQKHSGKEVVTASIDSLSFREPIYVGDHIVLRAAVNYVGHTSMEVGVQVIREDPCSGKQVRATTAHLTFVAIDKDKRPCPVPPILPQTADEKQRYENAKLRVQARKDLLKKINHSE